MTSADRPANTGPGDEPSGLPPELEDLLRQLTGGAEIPAELRSMLAGAGLDRIDPAMMGVLTHQIQALMTGGASGDGGFDDEQATGIARKVVATEGDPSITEGQTARVRDAVRTADLWLDPVTDLSAPGLTGRA